MIPRPSPGSCRTATGRCPANPLAQHCQTAAPHTKSSACMTGGKGGINVAPVDPDGHARAHARIRDGHARHQRAHAAACQVGAISILAVARQPLQRFAR